MPLWSETCQYLDYVLVGYCLIASFWLLYQISILTFASSRLHLQSFILHRHKRPDGSELSVINILSSIMFLRNSLLLVFTLKNCLHCILAQSFMVVAVGSGGVWWRWVEKTRVVPRARRLPGVPSGTHACLDPPTCQWRRASAFTISGFGECEYFHFAWSNATQHWIIHIQWPISCMTMCATSSLPDTFVNHWWLKSVSTPVNW